LPFHVDVGIQTSTPINDVLVGVSVAATRQNAGRLVSGPEPGGVNVPARYRLRGDVDRAGRQSRRQAFARSGGNGGGVRQDDGQQECDWRDEKRRTRHTDSFDGEGALRATGTV
jgi:hypothetical protein